MTETEFDNLIHNSHDGHGRVSCKTRTMLKKHYGSEHANKIFDRLQTKEFIDEISYSEFQKIVNMIKKKD